MLADDLGAPYLPSLRTFLFYVQASAPPEIYTLSLHDALPIFPPEEALENVLQEGQSDGFLQDLIIGTAANLKEIDEEISRCLKRSEEHTSELQSRENLVCRLLLEKKNI